MSDSEGNQLPGGVHIVLESSSSSESDEEPRVEPLERGYAGFGLKRPAEAMDDDDDEGEADEAVEHREGDLAWYLRQYPRDKQLKLCAGYAAYLRAEKALAKN